MTQYSGIVHTYSATLPQKRTVTDRIIMADPMSIATINALGLHNESKFAFVNTPGVKYEWLEDTYNALTDLATDTTDLTDNSATTTIHVTSGAKFQVGDIIQIDDEYIWVSAVTTNALTVVRNKGGTQTTHASTSTVYIRYSARLTGTDADDSSQTEASSGYNYSTILQKTIKVSRSDALLKQYGIDNVVERHINKAMDEKMMQLCRMFYYGQRLEGSSTTPRSAGGIETFVTTNDYAASSAALTQKMIEDEMQDCFDAGGAPNLILCGGWAKRKITDFYSGYVRTERSETMGGMTIDKITMPLGITADIVVDRHCPTNKLYLLDTRYVGFITLDDFFFEELAKSGDTAGPRGYGEVVGEYGLVCAFEKAHSYISGFSTSA